jgi:hypothetical protein
MKALQRLVVAVLLGVWCFPAVSVADTLPASRGEVGSRAPAGMAPAQTAAATSESEASDLGAREKQSQDLQDFKGGGVYIYLGSGAALVILIILLILVL